MTTFKTIYIYGAGGHGKSSADILLNTSPSLDLTFLDDFCEETSLLGFPVQKEITEQKPVFIAIGNNQTRKRLFLELKKSHFISAISSLSYVSKYVSLGKNIFIGNFAHIGPGVVVGSNSIINTAAIVEHDVLIGNHTHISINATISGGANIENEVFVGANATVVNNVKVTSEVTIGAGAVVTSDINIPGIYAGVPAKRIN